MQFTLDGTTLIISIIGALWAVCLAAVGVWVKRVQRDAETDRDELGKVKKDLADFREMVARDYASRAEVRNERQEVRDILNRIDQKVTDLSSKVLSR